MTRIERALRIQQQVLEIAATDPFYMHTNSGLAQVAYGLGWNARIHTLLYPERGRRFVLGLICLMDIGAAHGFRTGCASGLTQGQRCSHSNGWNDIFDW